MIRFAITRRAAASRILAGRVRASQLLASIVPALLLAACHGDDPQVPTALASSTTVAISGTVGTAVATAPTVVLKDQKGHGIANVWVHWSLPLNAGHVTNDSSKTDASGLALSGGWTLGPTAGAQTLTATANNLQPTVITAQAAPGPVQALVVLGNAQTAVVNNAVTSAPSVRAVDSYGNAVPGITITFTVTSGNGTLTGATQVSNADGIATAGSWTLGTLAGDQTIRANTTTNNISATLTARAIGGAAVSMAIVEGDAQKGSFGKRICVSPTIKVLDAFGNPVGQVPISFTPSAGSGSVAVSTVLTDATTGKASVGAWTLGSNTTQTLVGTSTALPGKQLTFTVSADVGAGYTICARFIGDAGTPRQREAVTKALAKWQTVIVGHVQTSHLTAPANECVDDVPAINEDVEDLLLYVELAAIDGPLNIIGQSAPCYLHSSGLTMMGFLQLDIADLDLMIADGTLDNVVLHEIGHILGIGTLWNIRHNLLTGAGTSNPFFTGAVARDGFASTGSPYSGTPVPVENSGGAGTRDSHWRRTVFGNELMNGYAAAVMPMSRVTIGSLADLGYTVNLAAADPFSLVPSLIGTVAPTREMPSDVADAPIWIVERDGSKTLVRIPTVPIRR
ncbi:MAG: leishmanolysin-related zinc metalloendopeptidase [Gemmatimonadaceae bacterium]